MAIKTELIWDGKYDANGKKVAPSRIALPFQTIETVNESTKDRQLNLFQAASKAQPWRNRLIWGDKKYVLPSLLPEFAGKVDLIYIDPPFDIGADFSFSASLPEWDEDANSELVSFTKQPNLIEQKAYRDTWGRDLDSYAHWLYETSSLLCELLSPTGSLFVHLGWNVAFLGRSILDEIFGRDRCKNEIIWKRTTAHSDGKQGSVRFGSVHDVILYYSKSEKCTFNPGWQPYDQSYIDSHYSLVEEATGRRYQMDNLTAGKKGGDTSYDWKGVRPYPGRYWAYSKTKMEEFERQGRLAYTKTGMPRYKRYLDEMPGRPIQDVWDDVSPVNSQATERLGYPTQKPEPLIERIVKVASNENNLVLDCFIGSGTTAAVSEKLNRRWIACDLGRFAIHTTRKRLLAISEVRPFMIQNLGKYERQAWQAGTFEAGSETSEAAARRHRAYIDFIVGLYHATPLSGHAWLHGVKKGRMIHVGAVDAPVTTSDVRQIATEFRRVVGSGKEAPTTNGVDVLGWDFAFEINEVAKQQAIDANIQMLFKKIPRDVMDKRAVEQGDIHFFELAALAVDAKAKGRDVTLTLSNFVIHPDDVPADVMAKVTHWSQWIDYWAVDWDHKGDTFHNQWQAFRTRKEPKLTPSATHHYDEPGEYRVVVKVIDILGNDTTKTLKVAVAK